ncbi:MAG: hypothetical protein WBQ50_09995 [Nocardioides sp.]
MEIAGLPAHPLIIHATVVLAPLAAVLVIVFAVWPRNRWLTRWPAAVGAVVAVIVVWAARLSGASMLEANPALRQLVATHQERAELASLVVIGFTVLTLVGTWSLGGPTALASGRGERESRVVVLDKVMPAVLVVAAVAMIASVVLAGDAGARAVWG